MMSTMSVYVKKMRMDEAIDFWHTHLGHARYAKLKIVMLQLILKSLPKLDIVRGIICAGV